MGCASSVIVPAIPAVKDVRGRDAESQTEPILLEGYAPQPMPVGGYPPYQPPDNIKVTAGGGAPKAPSPVKLRPLLQARPPPTPLPAAGLSPPRPSPLTRTSPHAVDAVDDAIELLPKLPSPRPAVVDHESAIIAPPPPPPVTQWSPPPITARDAATLAAILAAGGAPPGTEIEWVPPGHAVGPPVAPETMALFLKGLISRITAAGLMRDGRPPEPVARRAWHATQRAVMSQGGRPLTVGPLSVADMAAVVDWVRTEEHQCATVRAAEVTEDAVAATERLAFVAACATATDAQRATAVRPPPSPPSITDASLARIARGGPAAWSEAAAVDAAASCTASLIVLGVGRGDTALERSYWERYAAPRLRDAAAAVGTALVITDPQGTESDDESAAATDAAVARMLSDPSHDGWTIVAFVGERYGPLPLPASVPAPDMAALLAALPDGDDKAVVASWYRHDGEAYALRPPGAVAASPMPVPVRGYASDHHGGPGARSILLRVMPAAAAAAGPGRDARWVTCPGHAALTAAVAAIPGSVIVCVRTCDGLIAAVAQGHPGARWLAATEGREAASIASLRQSLPTGAGSIATSVPWDALAAVASPPIVHGVDDITAAVGQHYLRSTCASLYAAVAARLEDGRHRRGTIPASHAEAVASAAATARLAASYIARLDVLHAAGEHVGSSSPPRLKVIVGAPGSGRTTLLAALASRCPEITALSPVAGCHDPPPSPGDALADAARRLGALLACATPARPLHLWIDGLELLEDGHGGRPDPSWLPTHLPAGVTLVVTCAAGDQALEALASSGALLPSDVFHIPPLGVPEAEAAIVALVTHGRKVMSPPQLTAVRAALRDPECCPATMLYCRLVANIALRWAPYTQPLRLPVSLGDLVESVFDRAERDHGAALVHRTLGLSLASQDGLDDAELADALAACDDLLGWPGCPGTVWERADHAPVVRRVPPSKLSALMDGLAATLSFARPHPSARAPAFQSRVMLRAARARYFTGPSQHMLCGLLADLFSGTSAARWPARGISPQPLRWPAGPGGGEPAVNRRAVREWPAALMGCGRPRFGDLCSLLTAFDFVAASCDAGRVDDLIAQLAHCVRGCAALRDGDTDPPTALAATAHRLDEYLTAVLACAPDLRRLPGAAVHTLANAPKGNATAAAAREHMAMRGGTGGPWVEHLNRGDATQGGLRHTLRVGQTGGRGAAAIAIAEFAPNCRVAAVATANAEFLVFDAVTGLRLPSPPAPPRPGTPVALTFSADSKWLLVATDAGDAAAVLWDVSLGALHRTLGDGVCGRTTAATLTGDGATAITFDASSCDGTAWDASGGTVKHVYRGHTAAVDGLSMSLDATHLATASGDDHTVRVWSHRGEQLQCLASDGPVRDVAWLPGGWLATGGDEMLLRLYRRTKGVETGSPLVLTRSIPCSGAAQDARGDQRAAIAQRGRRLGSLRVGGDPTGRLVAVICSPPPGVSGPSVARVWQLATGRHEATLADMHGLRFRLDGALAVALGGPQTGARVYDCAGWTIRARLPAGATNPAAGSLTAGLFARDGLSILTATTAGEVHLWAAHQPSPPPAAGAASRRVSAAAARSWTAAGRRTSINTAAPDDVAPGAALFGASITVCANQGIGVCACALSRDGRRVAAGGADGTTRVFDAQTGELLATTPPSHTGALIGVHFDARGGRLLTAGVDGTARVWGLPQCDLIAVLRGHVGPLTAALFGPGDGDDDDSDLWVATAGADGDIRLWSLDGDTPTCRVIAAHADAVTSVVLVAHKLLLSAGADGRLRLWDPVTGSQLLDCTGSSRELTSCAATNDGHLVASGSADGAARLYDVATGRLVAVFGAPTKRPEGVDASTLVTPAALAGRHYPNAGCVSVAFSADGETLCTVSDDATGRAVVCQWDIADAGTPLRLLCRAPRPSCANWWRAMAAHPLTAMLVVGDAAGGAILYDGAHGEPLASLPGHTASITCVAFSADGAVIGTGSEDGTLRLSGCKSVAASLVGHKTAVTTATLSRDGDLLLTVSASGAIVWDIARGERRHALKAPAGVALIGGRFHPSQALFALAAQSPGAVMFHDVATGDLLRTIDVTHVDGEVMHFGFSAHGGRMITVTGTGSGRVWCTVATTAADASAPRRVAELRTSPEGDSPVALVATQRHLAVAGGRVLQLLVHPTLPRVAAVCATGAGVYDATSGSRLLDLGAGVTCGALSPDGALLAVGRGDGVVVAWSLCGPRDLEALYSIQAHAATIQCLAFAEGSHLLLSASSDCCARCLVADTGDEAREFGDDHAQELRGCAFGAADTIAVAWAVDETVYVWDVDTAVLLRTHLPGPLDKGVFVGPDGLTLLKTGGQGAAGAGALLPRVWNVSTGKQGASLDEHAEHFVAAMGRAGPDQMVATGSADGVTLWSSTGRLLHELAGLADGCGVLAMSGDAGLLLGGGPDGGAALWETERGERLSSLAGHGDAEVTAAAFSADGKTAATGDERGGVIIWAVAGLDSRNDPTAFAGRVSVLTGHTEPAIEGVLSPDGDLALTTGCDQTARLFDATTGTPLHVFTTAATPRAIFSSSFATDQTCYITDGPKIVVFSVARMAAVRTLTLSPASGSRSGDVDSLLSSPDGAILAASWRGASTIVLLNCLQSSVQGLLSCPGSAGTVAHVAFSADGRRLVVAYAAPAGGSLGRLWDVRKATLLGQLRGHDAPLTQCAFGPGAGSFVVTASEDGSARLWDVPAAPAPREDDGDTVAPWPVVVDPASPLLHAAVAGVVLSPRGEWAITWLTGSPTASMWDVESGTLVATLAGVESREWLHAAFAPGGEGDIVFTAAIEEDQGTQRRRVHAATAYHAPSGDIVFHAAGLARPPRQLAGWYGVLPAPGGELVLVVMDGDLDATDSAVSLVVVDTKTCSRGSALAVYPPGMTLGLPAFSPDGSKLAVHLGAAIDVWAVKGPGGRLYALTPNEAAPSFNALAWSPDGTACLTSAGKSAVTWDGATGTTRLTLSHAETVTSAAWSRDGRTILTLAPQQRRACLWDASTGRQWHALTSRTAAMAAASWSPDGLWVLTYAERDAIKLWGVDRGNEVGALGGADPPPMLHHGWSADAAHVIIATARPAVLHVFDRASSREVASFALAAAPTHLAVAELRQGGAGGGGALLAAGDVAGNVYLLRFHAG